MSIKKKECLPHTPPRAETKISTMFCLIFISNIVAQVPLDNVGELTLDFSKVCHNAPFLSFHLMKWLSVMWNPSHNLFIVYAFITDLLLFELA